MDLFNKIKNQQLGNAAEQQGDAAAQQSNPAAGGEQEDYLDKGVDALERKFGGGKIDPVKQRETNEKVTDKARGFLEGKGVHVPKAFSN